MKSKSTSVKANPDFDLKTTSFLPAEEYRHVYNTHVICVTDSKGYAQPENVDLAKLRVDATDGFIPLWSKDVSLNWRFNLLFDRFLRSPEAAKNGVFRLFGEA